MDAMKNKAPSRWDLLSPRQQKIYNLLLENGDSLTLDAIREELDVRSINTVVYHLKQLERSGFIRRNGDYGQIEVLPKPVEDVVYLNLYGLVRCGRDGFFNDGNVVDHVPFPARQMRVNPNSFLVEARGDSMEPVIHDRDFVLVEKGPVDSGDMAVVIYDEGAILKTVYKKGAHIILDSLNPQTSPIIAKPQDVAPIGVVRGIVRRFSDQGSKVKKSRS